MKKNVKPVPDGYHTVTPYLTIRNAGQAIDYYKRAFGAKEIYRMDMPGGRVAHAELQIGDSRIFVSDEFPEMGAKSPQALNGTPVGIFLYVNNVDDLFKSAMSAGGTQLQAPQDMFWGDRWARVRDPFGHEWQIATHIEDVTPEEMEKRHAKMFAGQGQS